MLIIPGVKITGSTILGFLGNTRTIFKKKLNKTMFKIIVAQISMLLILSSLSSFDITSSTAEVIEYFEALFLTFSKLPGLNK